MIDFVKAFERGQKAVDRAREARLDIEAVLDALTAAVLDSTEGVIDLRVRTFKVPLFGIITTIGRLDDPSVPDSGSQKWFSALNKRAGEQSLRRLAKWSEGFDGYPCSISYGGKEVNCFDRESLENALAAFLANSWVADQIHQLLSLPQSEPPADSLEPDEV